VPEKLFKFQSDFHFISVNRCSLKCYS